MTEEIDVMAALSHPLPRISATAFAAAEKRGEFVLHALLHQMEGRKPDSLALLVVAWNRCSDAERATFIGELLRSAPP